MNELEQRKEIDLMSIEERKKIKLNVIKFSRTNQCRVINGMKNAEIYNLGELLDAYQNGFLKYKSVRNESDKKFLKIYDKEKTPISFIDNLGNKSLKDIYRCLNYFFPTIKLPNIGITNEKFTLYSIPDSNQEVKK